MIAIFIAKSILSVAAVYAFLYLTNNYLLRGESDNLDYPTEEPEFSNTEKSAEQLLKESHHV